MRGIRVSVKRRRRRHARETEADTQGGSGPAARVILTHECVLDRTKEGQHVIFHHNDRLQIAMIMIKNGHKR